MKKLIANIIAAFIPSRNLRHCVRIKIVGNEPSVTDVLCAVNAFKNDFQEGAWAAKLKNNLMEELSKRRNILSVIDVGRKFGDDFKSYFINQNMPQRIAELKSGLDDRSIEVVDNKIRHFLNLPLILTPFERHSQFDTRDVLYTQEELEENRKFISQLPDLKYKYPGDFVVMLPEVFFYHHGLKFLSKEMHDYIKDKVFIDAGASIGDSSVVFNEYSPSKVYAFETSPLKKIKYYQNLKLNNIDIEKFEFVNKGVWNDNYSEAEIEFAKLDDYVTRHTDVGLIKMDVEGAEYAAVSGAKEIIKTSMPLLLITIYHTPRQFFELKPLIKEISDNSYDFIIRNLNFYIHNELETTLIAIPKNILKKY